MFISTKSEYKPLTQPWNVIAFANHIITSIRKSSIRHIGNTRYEANLQEHSNISSRGPYNFRSSIFYVVLLATSYKIYGTGVKLQEHYVTNIIA